jgi:hypothetical protein
MVLMFAATAIAATDAPAVGKVAQFRGQVARFGPDGAEQALAKADTLYLGDRIETRARSVVALRFRDDTMFEWSFIEAREDFDGQNLALTIRGEL